MVQMSLSIPGNVGMIAQHQHGRRRWYFGIQSKKDPAHVMTDVYKALMALGCEWMQLSLYRIKFRWRPNSTSTRRGYMSFGTQTRAGKRESESEMVGDAKMNVISGQDGHLVREMNVISGEDGHLVRVPNLLVPDYCIKIELTLYKVEQQSIYVLDFEKMMGDAFSFMTLCGNILTEIKSLSATSNNNPST